MCLGCIDSSKYTGAMCVFAFDLFVFARSLTTGLSSNYVPVSSEGYWEVPMDGISVNGAVVPGTGVSAAIDTGTTCVPLCFGPPDLV